MTATGKPALGMTPLKNYPLMTETSGVHQLSAIFNTTELPGAYSRPNTYSLRTGRLITDMNIQQSLHVLTLYKTSKYRLIKLLEFTW